MIKNVIVTGGANGIGLCCAKKFFDNGYNVFVLDNDIKAINNINSNGIEFFKCDVSNDKEVDLVAKLIMKKVDEINIIINCAGIQIEDSFSNYDKTTWQKVMNTNYFGTCNVIHSFMKYMKEGATILNLISVHSYKPRTFKYAYDSSKSAIEMLTKELGIDFADKHITVNALSFGAVETNMNKIFLKDQSKREEARKKVPLKIIFKPNQIANFAYDIITKFSNYTTGSTFVIDGGRSLI